MRWEHGHWAICLHQGNQRWEHRHRGVCLHQVIRQLVKDLTRQKVNVRRSMQTSLAKCSQGEGQAREKVKPVP